MNENRYLDLLFYEGNETISTQQSNLESSNAIKIMKIDLTKLIDANV